MMSVNKKDYKVVEAMHGYEKVYEVRKKFLWIFWKHIKTFPNKRTAHAYINFLK